MTATTIHVRLDAKTTAMLDELTAHYAQRAAALGLPYSRSDTVRVLLRAAHSDMRDELAQASSSCPTADRVPRIASAPMRHG